LRGKDVPNNVSANLRIETHRVTFTTASSGFQSGSLTFGAAFTVPPTVVITLGTTESGNTYYAPDIFSVTTTQVQYRYYVPAPSTLHWTVHIIVIGY